MARKLRIVIAKPGLDGHDRGAKVIARALRDAGKKTRATRGYVDQVAAQMILQGYLDWRQHAAHAAEPSQ